MNIITKNNIELLNDIENEENGFAVLIDKPVDWTSFDIVHKLKGLFKIKKIGHAGTLDPFATGLLIVCVKRGATKQISTFQNMPKVYSGVIKFGLETDSYDKTGKIVNEISKVLKTEDIEKIIKENFLGEVVQMPPIFSALKVNGVRSYTLARKGEKPKLQTRTINIYDFENSKYNQDDETLEFKITCSVGTYIRSIAHDIGEKLESCAHLQELRRENIGEYSVDDALSIIEIEEFIKNGN